MKPIYNVCFTLDDGSRLHERYSHLLPAMRRAYRARRSFSRRPYVLVTYSGVAKEAQ